MTKGATKLLCNGYPASERVLSYCAKLLGYKFLNKAIQGQNDETMIGAPFYYSLKDEQKLVFTAKRITPPNVVLAVKRVVVDGKLFHSRLTTKQKKLLIVVFV